MNAPYRTLAEVVPDPDPCPEAFEGDRAPTRRHPYPVRVRYGCALTVRHDGDCAWRVVDETRISVEEFVQRRNELWNKLLRDIAVAIRGGVVP